MYIYIYAATVKDMREGCILALFLGSHFWALKSMFFSIFSDRKNSEYCQGKKETRMTRARKEKVGGSGKLLSPDIPSNNQNSLSPAF